MREKIVNDMLEIIGKPFVENGRIKEVGFDCVGTIIYVALKNNLEVFDIKGYSQNPNNGLFLKAIDNNLEKVKKENIKIGDLIIFSMLNEFHHIAMITKIDKEIYITHAVSGSTNKVVMHEFGKYWKSKKHRFYKFKGIE